MSDIVEKTLLATNRGTRQIFQEAYRDSLDPSNWSWAHSIWLRSGIITKTVQTYCEQALNPPLPLDMPDNHEHMQR